MWGLQSEDSPKPDQLLDDGDTVTVGNITFKVLHTPGHTPGGISLYADKSVFVRGHPVCRLHRTDRFSGGRFQHIDQ